MKIKVVIADDNKQLSNVLEKYLSSETDFEVVGIAKNGTEVLELIREKKPDLLLLDIIMPELDGLGVLEKLKSMDIEPLKVIVLSTIGQDHVTQRAVRLGADYYIVKPFDMSVLVKRIRQLFNGDDFYIDMEERISEELIKMGIHANLKGYIYLRDAIKIVYMEKGTRPSITKDIYPAIAKKYDTEPHLVKSAIEHAIEVALSRSEGNINKLFDKSNSTNGEFISMIVEDLRNNRQ